MTTEDHVTKCSVCGHEMSKYGGVQNDDGTWRHLACGAAGTCQVCGKGETELDARTDEWPVSHLDCVKRLASNIADFKAIYEDEKAKRQKAEAEVATLREQLLMEAENRESMAKEVAALSKSEELCKSARSHAADCKRLVTACENDLDAERMKRREAEAEVDDMRQQASDEYERRIKAEAEVERLKWYIEDICSRVSAGTMYGPMPWTSKDEMLADLARRYEAHRNQQQPREDAHRG